jgi:protein-disulfide isomerase
MHSGPVVELLKRDIADANRLNVRGTPTVFINGRRFEKQSVEDFIEAIDRELAAGSS